MRFLDGNGQYDMNNKHVHGKDKVLLLCILLFVYLCLYSNQSAKMQKSAL
jgi:hypothetical protein